MTPAEKFVDQHLAGFRNPVLVAKTLEILRDPTCEAQALVSVLEKEPGLSSRVLKSANSALFGMPKSITSLKSAVVRLGNQNVARLALCAGLTPAPSPAWAGYWSHSLAVGMLSRHMAGFLGRTGVEQEEFFSMGLLHDLGVLLEIASGDFAKVESKLKENPMPLSQAEISALEFDHGEVGLLLAARWNFPGSLTHAIGFHHHPDKAGDYFTSAAIIHLADLVSHSVGLKLSEWEGAPTATESCLEKLRIPVEQLVLFGEWLEARKESISGAGKDLAG